MKKRAGVVLIILAAVLIVGGFAVVAYRTPKSEADTTEVSEQDELLNKNILANYPSTPREVIKLFNRYILALYGTQGEDLTKEQIQTLGTKMRDLYDEELLETNPQETNLDSLEQELTAFRSKDKVILQASVCDSNDVEFIDINDASGALVQVSYFIKTGSKEFTRTYQQFLLRKSDQGDWKILGFDKVDGGEN